jgi:hypothetical protein
MSNPRGPSSSEPQDLNSDQMELSRYKRLYNQAREDLENLNGEAKKRSIQTLFLQFVLTD